VPRKTPQQKKRESYRKDRRNTYGENSKSSRKGVRLRKKKVNRANRRTEHQAVTGPVLVSDVETAEQMDESVAAKRRKTWSKARDTPLGEVVVKKLKRRERLGIDSPKSVKAKLKRIKRRGGTTKR